MVYRSGPGVGYGQATDSTVYAVCIVLSEVKHMVSARRWEKAFSTSLVSVKPSLTNSNLQCLS